MVDEKAQEGRPLKEICEELGITYNQGVVQTTRYHNKKKYMIGSSQGWIIKPEHEEDIITVLQGKKPRGFFSRLFGDGKETPQKPADNGGRDSLESIAEQSASEPGTPSVPLQAVLQPPPTTYANDSIDTRLEPAEALAAQNDQPPVQPNEAVQPVQLPEGHEPIARPQAVYLVFSHCGDKLKDAGDIQPALESRCINYGNEQTGPVYSLSEVYALIKEYNPSFNPIKEDLTPGQRNTPVPGDAESWEGILNRKLKHEKTAAQSGGLSPAPPSPTLEAVGEGDPTPAYGSAQAQPSLRLYAVGDQDQTPVHGSAQVAAAQPEPTQRTISGNDAQRIARGRLERLGLHGIAPLACVGEYAERVHGLDGVFDESSQIDQSRFETALSGFTKGLPGFERECVRAGKVFDGPIELAVGYMSYLANPRGST